MYPRYHSNCTPQGGYHSSGSSKPYALTRQSREHPTWRAARFGPPARKGWDHGHRRRRASTIPDSLHARRARPSSSSLFLIQFEGILLQRQADVKKNFAPRHPVPPSYAASPSVVPPKKPLSRRMAKIPLEIPVPIYYNRPHKTQIRGRQAHPAAPLSDRGAPGAGHRAARVV